LAAGRPLTNPIASLWERWKKTAIGARNQRDCNHEAGLADSFAF
jgi:hypothetical protein